MGYSKPQWLLTAVSRRLCRGNLCLCRIESLCCCKSCCCQLALTGASDSPMTVDSDRAHWHGARAVPGKHCNGSKIVLTPDMSSRFLCMIACAVAAAAQPQTESWAMFGRDAQRTHRSSELWNTGNLGARILWSPFRGDIVSLSSTPISASQRALYIGCATYAVDALSGVSTPLGASVAPAVGKTTCSPSLSSAALG